MENKKPPSPTKLVCFKSFANPEANRLVYQTQCILRRVCHLVNLEQNGKLFFKWKFEYVDISRTTYS